MSTVNAITAAQRKLNDAVRAACEDGARVDLDTVDISEHGHRWPRPMLTVSVTFDPTHKEKR